MDVIRAGPLANLVQLYFCILIIEQMKEMEHCYAIMYQNLYIENYNFDHEGLHIFHSQQQSITQIEYLNNLPRRQKNKFNLR